MSESNLCLYHEPERLKERQNGFEVFLTSLADVGLDEVALGSLNSGEVELLKNGLCLLVPTELVHEDGAHRSSEMLRCFIGDGRLRSFLSKHVHRFFL